MWSPASVVVHHGGGADETSHAGILGSPSVRFSARKEFDEGSLETVEFRVEPFSPLQIGVRQFI